MRVRARAHPLCGHQSMNSEMGARETRGMKAREREGNEKETRRGRAEVLMRALNRSQHSVKARLAAPCHSHKLTTRAWEGGKKRGEGKVAGEDSEAYTGREAALKHHPGIAPYHWFKHSNQAREGREKKGEEEGGRRGSRCVNWTEEPHQKHHHGLASYHSYKFSHALLALLRARGMLECIPRLRCEQLYCALYGGVYQRRQWEF